MSPFRRSNTSAEPTTTLLPFPPVRQLPLLPRVRTRLPASLITNAPTNLEYLVSNPTPRPLHLATQVDQPNPPGSFVFASSRQTPSLVLAPGEEKIVSVKIVPLVPGQLTIPRFRVFSVEQQPVSSPEIDQDGRQLPPPPPRMRELEVEVELEMAEGGREGARPIEGGTGQPRVMVMPSRSYPPERE